MFHMNLTLIFLSKLFTLAVSMLLSIKVLCSISPIIQCDNALKSYSSRMGHGSNNMGVLELIFQPSEANRHLGVVVNAWQFLQLKKNAFCTYTFGVNFSC